MDLTTQACMYFIREFGAPIHDIRVSGVAIAPVMMHSLEDGSHQYDLYLAHEKWGRNAGFLNFFGGSLECSWPNSATSSDALNLLRVRAILKTAVRELWEETGIVVGAMELVTSMFSVGYLSSRSDHHVRSIILMIRCVNDAHMTRTFRQMVHKRRRDGAPECMREHSDSQLVCMAHKKTSVHYRSAIPRGVSTYVRDVWASMNHKLAVALRAGHFYVPELSFRSIDV